MRNRMSVKACHAIAWELPEVGKGTGKTIVPGEIELSKVAGKDDGHGTSALANGMFGSTDTATSPLNSNRRFCFFPNDLPASWGSHVRSIPMATRTETNRST